MLWALALSLEPAASRKAKAQDALKQLGIDTANSESIADFGNGGTASNKNNREAAFVALEIGKLFSGERRWQQAHQFFNQAVKFDKDNGDAWAHLIKFEQE